jgi:hypothetical protein
LSAVGRALRDWLASGPGSGKDHTDDAQDDLENQQMLQLMILSVLARIFLSDRCNRRFVGRHSRREHIQPESNLRAVPFMVIQ